jgi:hypothetical protein
MQTTKACYEIYQSLTIRLIHADISQYSTFSIVCKMITNFLYHKRVYRQ